MTSSLLPAATDKYKRCKSAIEIQRLGQSSRLVRGWTVRRFIPPHEEPKMEPIAGGISFFFLFWVFWGMRCSDVLLHPSFPQEDLRASRRCRLPRFRRGSFTRAMAGSVLLRRYRKGPIPTDWIDRSGRRQIDARRGRQTCHDRGTGRITPSW